MALRNATTDANKSWLNIKCNTLQANDVTIDEVAVRDLIDDITSAGVKSGFGLTDNLDGTVTIATGDCYLRESDSDLANIKQFTVPPATLTLTDASINFVYVDYNAGTPQLGVTTVSTTINQNTIFSLYEIVRESTTLHIKESKQFQNNDNKRIQEFLSNKFNVTQTDGLGLGETGSHKVTLTSGKIWYRLNQKLMPSFDTSGTDTFFRYYRVGAVYTQQVGVTDWDAFNYNDVTSGLSGFLPGNYSYQDFYILWDGTVHCMYAEANYPSLSLAEDGPIIPLISRYESISLYVGRIVFIFGGATAAAILSPFSTNLDPVSSVGIHAHLSGLAADDHTQYALLLGRAAGQKIYGGTAASDDLTLESTSNASKGNIILPDITADSIMSTGSSQEIVPVTVGNSLSFTAPTLDAIQDIRTTATPSFLGIKADTIDEQGVGNGVDVELVHCENGKITLGLGAEIDEFDTDPTLAADSDSKVPTQKAVKAYCSAGSYWQRTGTEIHPNTTGDTLGIDTITEEQASGNGVTIMSVKIDDDDISQVDHITFLDEDDDNKIQLDANMFIGVNGGDMQFRTLDDTKSFNFKFNGTNRLFIREDSSDCELFNPNGALILDGGVAANNVNLTNVNTMESQDENNDQKWILKRNGSGLANAQDRIGIVSNYFEFNKPTGSNGYRLQFGGSDHLTLDETVGLGLASGVDVNAILDEDTLVSDSDTALATQQSIKAYADTKISATGIAGGQTIIGGTGSGDDLTFQTTSDASKGDYIFSDLTADRIMLCGSSKEIDTTTHGVGITVSNILTGSSIGLQVTNSGGLIELKDHSNNAQFDIVSATGLCRVTTGLELTYGTASRLLSTNGSSVCTSTDLNSWVTGTTNQISVADDGDGTITLSTPQNLHTAASPTFASPDFSGTLTVDAINEHTGTNGVSVDGLLIKDGQLSINSRSLNLDNDNITFEPTGNGSVRINGNATSGDSILYLNRDAQSDGAVIEFHTADALKTSMGLSGGTDNFFIYDQASASERLTMDTSGIFYMSAVKDNVVTDRDVHIDSTTGELGYDSSLTAHKMNILSLPNADWIYNITPVSYNRRTKIDTQILVENSENITRADGTIPDQIAVTSREFTDTPHPWTEYGFTAEDVNSACPDACFYDDEVTKTGLAGIRKMSLIAGLVKCVQEQKQLIEDLTAKVDSIKKDVTMKCRAATSVNITLSGLQEIDGVQLEDSNLVLVRAQTDKTENGVYIASANQWTKITAISYPGSMVTVIEGLLQADSVWLCITNIDSDQIEYITIS